MQHVKKAMRDVKDKSRLGGIAVQIVDEYLGDKVGFISVSNHHDKLMLVADMKAQAEEHNHVFETFHGLSRVGRAACAFLRTQK